MDYRVHGWFASHRSQDEHNVKKAQGVSYEPALKNMAGFFFPLHPGNSQETIC